MGLLGIISGTIILRDFEGELREDLIDTPFGRAPVLIGKKFAYIARHGTEKSRPILPHVINHPANLSAFKQIGIEEIIAVNSTGSLKKDLEPGMLVVPGDFMSFSPAPTICRDGQAIHVVPALSAKVRTALLEAARDCGVPVHDGGIYWQTPGPRFETRAEIAMMSQYADLVGMTMASEAVVANELGLAYAAICSVDNYANGIVDKELTLTEVVAHARRSAETMIRIVQHLVERR